MSVVNFRTEVTLKEAANLIVNCRGNRFNLLGEPGIGKTMLLKTIANMLAEIYGEGYYETAYVDVPNLDLGDVCMPVIDRDTKTTTYYPNERFKVHTGKPVVMLYDEFSKGSEPVKNMLHPSINEGRFGDKTLHPETIIILTGNLSSDNVGDSLKAHTINRITTIYIKKPIAQECIEWGMENGVDETLLAFAHQFPHIFASYTDPAQADNHYIYHPNKAKGAIAAFLSPRSWAKASPIVKARKVLGTNAVIAALAGTCGESFARDFQAYMEFADQLPTKEQIQIAPTTTPVPTSPAAQSIIVFGGVAWVDKATLPAFLKYMGRMPKEWQAVFAINLAKSSKQGMAFTCREFSEWVAANHDLLG